MEAIVLAGGKAERLGDAAGGRPKALVEVGGKPLAAYQVGAPRAGRRRRVIFAVRGRARGDAVRGASSRGSAPEIVAVEEPERLGRGGGDPVCGRPPRARSGDVFALNGDELVDVDFEGLLARHRATGAAATITVARPKSQFGARRRRRRRRRARLRARPVACPYWVNCGIYVLSEEALERFPERGDHESTAFPELAARGAPARVTATRASG